MSSQPTLRLVDRLRGKYVLPVNDGAGLLNGSDVFVREFPTPPIHKEAADRIEELETALRYYADDAVYDSGDVPGHVYVLDDHGDTARVVLGQPPRHKHPPSPRLRC